MGYSTDVIRKLTLADERTAAVGRVARLLLDKNMFSSDDIEKNLAYEGVAVHDLTTAVHLGHVDAAIVWEPVAAAYDEAEIVFIPAEKNIISPIPIAVLSFSRGICSSCLRPGYIKCIASFACFKLKAEVFQPHAEGCIIRRFCRLRDKLSKLSRYPFQCPVIKLERTF